MPHRKKLIPQTEDRRQKFERLLVSRMNRALDAIRLIGNLSSQNYRHEPEDMQLIRSALADKINETISRFEPRPVKRANFRFPAHQPKVHVIRHHNGQQHQA